MDNWKKDFNAIFGTDKEFALGDNSKFRVKCFIDQILEEKKIEKVNKITYAYAKEMAEYIVTGVSQKIMEKQNEMDYRAGENLDHGYDCPIMVSPQTDIILLLTLLPMTVKARGMPSIITI